MNPYPLYIHPLKSPSPISRHSLYVLREDLIPTALGGNKVRIARAFLSDMKKQGCDVMIAYGNVRSNLCRVLACLCRQEKIPCHVIASFDPGQEEGLTPTANEQMMRVFDAGIHPCTVDQIADTVQSLMDSLRSEGHKPYYIYGNRFGTGNEGTPALAYEEVYRMLLDAEARQGFSFDQIFLPSGTGSSQAGLSLGNLLHGDSPRIRGILISSRSYERAFSIIKEGIESGAARLKKALLHPAENYIRLEAGYTFGGYGCVDEEVLGCIREQLIENGLPLDPVYTGKAFLGMQRCLEAEETPQRILFIHTGGTPLFYDHLPLL